MPRKAEDVLERVFDSTINGITSSYLRHRSAGLGYDRQKPFPRRFYVATSIDGVQDEGFFLGATEYPRRVVNLVAQMLSDCSLVRPDKEWKVEVFHVHNDDYTGQDSESRTESLFSTLVDDEPFYGRFGQGRYLHTERIRNDPPAVNPVVTALEPEADLDAIGARWDDQLRWWRLMQAAWVVDSGHVNFRVSGENVRNWFTEEVI